MYKLDPTKDTLKFLNGLDAKQYRQIGRKIFSLLNNPLPHDCEEIKGTDNYFRVDIGEYRVIYRIEEETLKLVLIGIRNDGDVYKKLERKI